MNIIAKDQVGARLRTLANDVRVAYAAFEKARDAAEKAGLRVGCDTGPANLPNLWIVRPQETL